MHDFKTGVYADERGVRGHCCGVQQGSYRQGLRFTPMGLPVLTFTVACKSKEAKGGKPENQSTFVEISLFGKRAEEVWNVFDKGKAVKANGFLWEQTNTKNGKTYRQLKCEYVTHLEYEVDGKFVEFMQDSKPYEGLVSEPIEPWNEVKKEEETIQKNEPRRRN